MPGRARSLAGAAGFPYRTLLTLAAAAALLSGAALFNGFPQVWPDTGPYLDAYDLGYRTPFYSYLTYLLHWRWSMWPVVFAQAMLLAHLLWLVVRVVFSALSGIGYLAVILGTALLSSAPWYAGLLMPDLFASVVVLSLFLLAFHERDLSGGEREYLTLLCFLGIVVHLSHLPLAAGSLGVLLIMGSVARPAGFRFKEASIGLGTPVALADRRPIPAPGRVRRDG